MCGALFSCWRNRWVGIFLQRIESFYPPLLSCADLVTRGTAQCEERRGGGCEANPAERWNVGAKDEYLDTSVPWKVTQQWYLLSPLLLAIPSTSYQISKRKYRSVWTMPTSECVIVLGLTHQHIVMIGLQFINSIMVLSKANRLLDKTGFIGPLPLSSSDKERNTEQNTKNTAHTCKVPFISPSMTGCPYMTLSVIQQIWLVMA